jgi:hypothetical protein
VQPVTQLDDDDPGVLGDREQQLPVVLDLLFGRRVKRQAGDLGEPFDNPGHFGTELPGNVLGPNFRVFHHVVQQRGHDSCGVQQLLRQNHGDGNGVGHEVLT